MGAVTQFLSRLGCWYHRPHLAAGFCGPFFWGDAFAFGENFPLPRLLLRGFTPWRTFP